MSNHYKRLLDLQLPQKQSAFLWGARKTGKSTFLKNRYPKSLYIDLLKSDSFLKYSKEPHRFREEIDALSLQELQYPIILDEVQKVPALLDEVHWLIENTAAYFILCGSSARKLKRTGVNLLGGRAWKFHFFPLVYPEITDFDLLKVLQRGTLPSHYQSSNIKRSLTAYIEDYLKEEIMSEGLVRNLPAFARFLDTIGFSNAEMINYTNISRDCGIDSKTVKEYYQILLDTLLGHYIYPYKRQKRRDIITSTPKFYFFDTGLINSLANRKITQLKGVDAGKSFEQFIFNELVAYKYIKEQDYSIYYWRTKSGLEVDFILDQADVAIEVKISENIQRKELKGLIEFSLEKNWSKLFVVSLEHRKRKVRIDTKEVIIYPYQEFLNDLWSGKIAK